LRHIPHFIAGGRVDGTSGRASDVFNPNTGEVQARVALASAAEVAQAVDAAKAALPAWSAMNPQRRARVLFRFKELLEANMDDLAAMLSSEHGKVIADSKGDRQSHGGGHIEHRRAPRSSRVM
jgi:malonate-semialdehyde dehydrogenase (acetylating)/methylmalonate-semialdehyde dehydrogenase